MGTLVRSASVHVRIPAALLAVALAAGLLVTGAPGTSSATPSARQPDIVLLVIDDLTEMDLRVMERLPTIDRLFLQQGVRFTDYVGDDPLCCPGRATLLTGERSRDHGVIENDVRPWDPSVTIATELGAVGYRSALVGKYFNSANYRTDRTPPGWDHIFFGEGYFNATWFRDGKRVELGSADEDYTTDRVREDAVGWLRTVAPSDPILLYLSPFSVHAGDDQYGVRVKDQPAPAPRHVGDPRCAGLSDWQTPAHEGIDSGKPAYIRARNGAKWAAGWPMTRICETLLSTDELLAATEQELIAQGRTNVLYLMVADNGMSFGRFGWAGKHVPYATAMPFFMHWETALGTTPREIATTVTSTDIAPTLCAVAGCEMGPFANGKKVSGRSLLPLLVDGTPLRRGVVPTEHLCPRIDGGMPAWRGLQTTVSSPLGRWVLVHYLTGEVEMYDLTADPWELSNVANDPQYAVVRASLERMWAVLHPDPLTTTTCSGASDQAANRRSDRSGIAEAAQAAFRVDEGSRQVSARSAGRRAGMSGATLVDSGHVPVAQLDRAAAF